jgi:hypothetical protein
MRRWEIEESLTKWVGKMVGWPSEGRRSNTMVTKLVNIGVNMKAYFVINNR